MTTSNKYMARRKFYIPEKEKSRFYGNDKKTPCDFLFPSEYEEYEVDYGTDIFESEE